MWILDKMPTFYYKGCTQSGSIYTGTCLLADKDAVAGYLAKKGISLVWCRRQFSLTEFFGIKPKEEDWEPFFAYLAHTLKSGISLKGALDTYKEICGKRLAPFVQQIEEHTYGGGKVSAAFGQSFMCYAFYVQSILEVAENTGDLSSAFLKISTYFKARRYIKRKIKSVVRYPVFLSVFIMGILVCLCYFLLPRLKDFFAYAQYEMPWGTKIFITTLQVIQSYGLLLTIGIVGIGVSIKYLYTQTRHAIYLGRMVYTVPLIGCMLKTKALLEQADILSNLLSAGISLLRALEIIIRQTKNPFLQQEITRIKEEVNTGKAPSEAFKRSAIYPFFMTHMMQVGEKTNTLGQSFSYVRDYLQAQMEDRIAFLMETLQPILLCMLGVFILGIVYILFYPFYMYLEQVHF